MIYNIVLVILGILIGYILGYNVHKNIVTKWVEEVMIEQAEKLKEEEK